MFIIKIYELKLGNNSKYPLVGGLCLNEETSLLNSQSPYDGLLNMSLDNGGSLSKRKGQTYAFTSLGNYPIKGIYSDYKDKIIFACNSNLYTYDGATATEIAGATISNNNVAFFVFNGILYVLDGAGYYQYDGTTFKSVEAYKPRVSINRKPDGSESTVDESWNMLGGGFRDSFNGDGTSKDYILSIKNLDATAITAKVGTTSYTEGSGITVDRTLGKVTFTTAPITGNNNVEITAYKRNTTLENNIKNCTFAIEFSNRIFISGNANQKNTYFAGGLTDDGTASYFPQKYFYKVGGNDKSVTNFKVHQNKLIVFKEDLICTVEASTGLDNMASFPVSFLNTEVGCDIPNSVQLIDNNVVFANTQGGVYVIASTYIIGEKTVLCISQNINGDYSRNGLLAEVNLKSATSVDYDFKYWLCCGDKCYVLDYRNGYTVNDPNKNTWFLYDNIKANNFCIYENELYYGHNALGTLVKFINAKNDFGNGIPAIWKSKLFDFGYPEYLKTVENMWVTFTNKNSKPSDIKVKYYNENGGTVDTVTVRGDNKWSWDGFSWDDFTWAITVFDKTIKEKVKMKKIAYFQIEFSNDINNEDLAIKSIVLNYKLIRKVK